MSNVYVGLNVHPAFKNIWEQTKTRSSYVKNDCNNFLKLKLIKVHNNTRYLRGHYLQPIVIRKLFNGVELLTEAFCRDTFLPFLIKRFFCFLYIHHDPDTQIDEPQFHYIKEIIKFDLLVFILD